MEVLKEWTMDVICEGTPTLSSNLGCGATLRISPEDIYRVRMTVSQDETKSKFFVCCPSCRAETPVNKPPYIWAKGVRPEDTKTSGEALVSTFV